MSDYPGAIDYPAHPTNELGPPCTPRGLVLHTPEEPADTYPGTPYWFAQYHDEPDQRGSTHYFVAWWFGLVYQCVDESHAPIANGVLGKPYPSWANPGISLNRQSWSIEIEGEAATIQDTLVIGGPQWNSLVALIKHRNAARGIPNDREHIIGHYQVATNRTDPGAGFPWDALIRALNEEEPMTPAEKIQFEAMQKTVRDLQILALQAALRLNKYEKHTTHPPGQG